jgi:hypothetical protein
MIDQKNIEVERDNLAERCRIALERSYGSEVPLPNSTRKKKFRSILR